MMCTSYGPMCFSYGPTPEVPRPHVLAPHPLAPIVPLHLDLRAEAMMPAPLDPGPQPVSPKIQPPELEFSPEVPTQSPRQPPAPNLEPPEIADPGPQSLDPLGAGQGVDESYEAYYEAEENKENVHDVPKTKIARVLAERRMRSEADSQVSQTSDKQIVQVSVHTGSFAKSCKVEVHIHGLEDPQFYGVPAQAIGA